MGGRSEVVAADAETIPRRLIDAIQNNHVLQVNGNLDEFLFDLFESERLHCRLLQSLGFHPSTREGLAGRLGFTTRN